MYYNKKSLLVRKWASPEKDYRPHLSQVHFTKNGSTVATNGHGMAIVTKPESHYPDMPCPELDTIKEPFGVPMGEIDDLAKELNGSEFPAAYQGTREKEIDFVTISKRGVKRTSALHKSEEKFPPFEEVIPRDYTGDDFSHTCIDVSYLVLLASVAKEFLKGGGMKGVCIHVPKDDPLDPVVLECKYKETGQTLTQVIMPLRM